MQDVIYITKEGLNKLKEELKELKEVKVVEVAKRIQTARDQGDISENAEYDLAKQEQARTEGKISELEDIIKHAKISDNRSLPKDIIVIGSKVKVHVEGEEEEFHIVGALEANPLEKKISHESPIGCALMGKKPGEKIEIEAPIGKLTYTILSID
jgi:transcription elongation factor GreA